MAKGDIIAAIANPGQDARRARVMMEAEYDGETATALTPYSGDHGEQIRLIRHLQTRSHVEHVLTGRSKRKLHVV